MRCCLFLFVSVFLWCKLIALIHSHLILIRSVLSHYLNQFRCVQMLNFKIYCFITN